MGKADLHLHTNKSDGLLSPEQLVRQARKCELKAIAITDHDTIEGLQEGLDAGKRYKMEVVPGIEFNTNIDRGELHILGYFFDYTDMKLLKLIDKIKNARFNRVISMVQKLRKLGLNISFEDVLSKAKKDASLGRPHIARVLVESEYVSNIQEAFNKYIGSNCTAYVERYKLEPEEAIEIIIKSGGVPVLAHPGILNNTKHMYRCIESGIQGIEVYHSKHTAEQTIKFESIAREYKLIPTGGSDCHGDPDCNGELLLGQVTVSYSSVEKLKARSIKNRQGGFLNV